MNMIERLARTIAQYGDAFTVGIAPHTGIFSVLSSTGASALFDSTELSALPRPIYQAIVPADDLTAESDTLDWNGLSLTVQRVLPYRYRGQTIAKRLIVA